MTGPYDSPHGIVLRPATTPDDSFEDFAAEHLSRFKYRGVHLERTRALPRPNAVGREDHYRPDLRFWLPGFELGVADAKRRAVLTKADVEKVAEYQRTCGARDGWVLVPATCHVQRGALKAQQAALALVVAQGQGGTFEIVPLLWNGPGDTGGNSGPAGKAPRKHTNATKKATAGKRAARAGATKTAKAGAAAGSSATKAKAKASKRTSANMGAKATKRTGATKKAKGKRK